MYSRHRSPGHVDLLWSGGAQVKGDEAWCKVFSLDIEWHGCRSRLWLPSGKMAIHRFTARSQPTKSHSRTGTRESTQFMIKALWARLVAEFEITWRMLADNILASFTPGLVVVLAVSIRSKLQTWQMGMNLMRASLLCILYTYSFDAANQARGADEDKINKPHRPIPSGLMTPGGAMRRFWIAMVFYTATGWGFGVLEWVLLWQASTVIINICCPHRHHFWCKTFCMSLGITAQLSQSWQLVAPIDSIGQQWIRFMAVAYPPPLIYEDVRDMLGDKAAGRETLALMLGAWPIRIWFAVIMSLMPALVHIFPFYPIAAETWRVVLCDATVASICWTTVIRSLTMRSVKADRLTYQLFIFSYIVILGCGCFLWA